MSLLATPKLDLFFPFFPVPSSLSRPFVILIFAAIYYWLWPLTANIACPNPPFAQNYSPNLIEVCPEARLELNTAIIAESVQFYAAGQVVHQKTGKCNLPDNFLVVLSMLGSAFDTPPVHHISERQDLIFVCTASIMTIFLLIIINLYLSFSLFFIRIPLAT